MQNKSKKLVKIILPIFVLLAILLSSRLFVFNADEKAKADTVNPESMVVISNEEALSLGVDEKDLDDPCIVFDAQTNAGIYSDHNFRVVFDTLGGSPVPNSYPSVNAGDTIQKPSEIPKKDGYTFLYWEYKSICDGVNREWDFDNDVVVYDLILTAKYKKDDTAKTYIVKFNANGGGTNPPRQVIDEGGLAKRPADPVKAGYKFRGWFNGTTKWVFVRDTVTSDMTLIARYLKEDTPTPVKYTVSFDTDGGGTNPDNQILDEGSLVTKPSDPSKSGYTFKGWYNSSTSQLWDFANDTVTGDIKLIANYDSDVKDHIIKFNANGGGANPPNQTIPTGGLVKRPPVPSKAGYTFKGWFNGTVRWVFASDKVTEDMTLIARYVKDDTPETYTVSFDANGGGANPPNQVLIAGSLVTKPSDPSKSGFDFKGWHNISTSSFWDFTRDTVTANVSLIAFFEPSPSTKHKVTFDVDGGSPTPPVQFLDEGELVTKPSDPYKAGYTFMGWYIKTGTPGAKDKWDFVNDRVYGDVELGPLYIFDSYVSGKYIVTYYYQGGHPTSLKTTTAFVNKNGYLQKPITPYIPGKSFVGWMARTDAGDLGIWNFNSTVKSNMDLYAVFK